MDARLYGWSPRSEAAAERRGPRASKRCATELGLPKHPKATSHQQTLETCENITWNHYVKPLFETTMWNHYVKPLRTIIIKLSIICVLINQYELIIIEHHWSLYPITTTTNPAWPLSCNDTGRYKPLTKPLLANIRAIMIINHYQRLLTIADHCQCEA